jgi:hypothetical protein
MDMGKNDGEQGLLAGSSPPKNASGVTGYNNKNFLFQN